MQSPNLSLASCRSPEEADAQAIRVAILLDELDFPGFDKPDPRTGHIIVEVKTDDAKQMIEYSCSKRVIALPTGLLNARRYAASLPSHTQSPLLYTAYPCSGMPCWVDGSSLNQVLTACAALCLAQFVEPWLSQSLLSFM